MAPSSRVVTFRPDEDVYGAMLLLKDRDGIPLSEQIRRALRAWLESKKVLKLERVRPRRVALERRARTRADN